MANISESVVSARANSFFENEPKCQTAFVASDGTVFHTKAEADAYALFHQLGEVKQIDNPAFHKEAPKK